MTSSQPQTEIVQANRGEKNKNIVNFIENNESFFLNQRKNFVELYNLYLEKTQPGYELSKSQFSYEFRRTVESNGFVIRSYRAKSKTIFEVFVSVDFQKKSVAQI